MDGIHSVLLALLLQRRGGLVEELAELATQSCNVLVARVRGIRQGETGVERLYSRDHFLNLEPKQYVNQSFE